MKIEYSSSLEDLIAYHELLLESDLKDKNDQRLGAFMLSAIAVALIAFSFDVTKGLSEPVKWSIRLIAISFFVWQGLPSKKVKVARKEKFYRDYYQGKNSVGIWGKFSIELLQDTLRVSSEGCDSIYQRFRITEIIDHPDYAIIKMGLAARYVIPRAKIESGNLEELLQNLQSKGVERIPYAPAKPDRIQNGIYVFIAATACLIPALITYVAVDNAIIKKSLSCLMETKLGYQSLCFSQLRMQEIAFLCLSLMSVVLLSTSICMFYKNWKKISCARHTANDTAKTSKD
ncbi:MAG: hypothetical protein IT560_00755 [Alphaproteobacteria bacterium]|nr:hypothetical protein [Alphaproteobacteria bacterium]